MSVALAWLAAPALKPAPAAQVSAAQCAFRFNTYLGLSLALGILCVGASLSWQGGRGQGRLIGWMLTVKLALMPVAALALAALLSLGPIDRRMLLLFAALPTASSAYVPAMRMGGDGRLTALIISLSTLLSAVTIPAWILVGG